MSSSIEGKRNASNSRRRAPVTESQSRAESEAGGVRLPQNDAEPVGAEATPAPKRKRRPKKITNKAEEQTGKRIETVPAQKSTDVTVEVKALKSKVQEIEAQVQEILLRPAAPTKSARRRARQQKGAASSAASTGNEPDDTTEEKDAESHEATTANLQRLQDELKDAQEELVALRDKKAAAASTSQPEEEDDVEDIPRIHGPGLVETQRPRPLGRAVTLSGSYRIPIPVNVTDSDFDAISKGIRSAQNIARSFIDSSAESRRVPDRPAQASSNAGSSNSSWSEWIGGYTMSIAKAVDKVRITSNMETVPERPAIAGRSETAPPTRRKPQKLEMRNKKRSDLPGARRKLSDTQVAGLLA
jgi:hypothetical protein